MFLLVDVDSNRDAPELAHLLSFDSVEGLRIEPHVAFTEREAQNAKAVIGPDGTHQVTIPPFYSFKQLATEISEVPGCPFTSDTVHRALTYSFLADRLNADGVVSPARAAFHSRGQGLLRSPLFNVAEALAVIGAHVRQREHVPLGGIPPIVQERTEVYRMTAKIIIPGGQEWWSSCVQSSGKCHRDLIGFGQTTFMRIGQAVRGRDCVHESLRIGSGRSAILDALYHFDVVLMSSVGALDSLAQAADELFGLHSKPQDIAWQRERWRTNLSKVAPAVAGLLAPTTQLRAMLDIIVKIRNTIHGIPLDEYLSVDTTGPSSTVEHRVMMSSELSESIKDVGAKLIPLDRWGLFLDSPGQAFLNVGAFSENILTWIVRIVSELMAAMLKEPQMVTTQPPVILNRLEQLERQWCAGLAQIGNYPLISSPTGVAARRVRG